MQNNRKILIFLFGIGISVFILSLFYYWFKIANRSIVFLYNHDMGPYIPSTAPFSFVTRSRYWMAGVVASGAVMIFYTAINIITRVFNPHYQAPFWLAVWSVCAVSIIPGIPLITMTPQNAPPMPFGIALFITFVTLVSLALALQPGPFISRKPVAAAFLAVDGIGLSFILIGASSLERIQEWIERGANLYIFLMVVTVLGGAAIPLFVTALQFVMKRPLDTPFKMYLAGFCIAYPGMSILHHVLFTDGYFYITDSDNLLARNLLLQSMIWIAVWFFCVWINKLRTRLSYRRVKPS